MPAQIPEQEHNMHEDGSENEAAQQDIAHLLAQLGHLQIDETDADPSSQLGNM
jgi:hypothetical protein